MFSKTAGGFVLVLLTGLAVEPKVVFADDQDYMQEIEKEFNFAPGGTLILKNFKGQIEISGWEKDRAEIAVLKSVSKDTDPAKAREWLERVKVEVTRQGDEIKAVTLGDDKLPVDVSFWISVPRHTNVELKSLKSYVMLENLEGDIKLDVVDGSMLLQNLDGYIALNLVNGPMLLEGLKGNLSTKTVNGNIQAHVDGLDSSKLCTVNGKITLIMPGSAAVDLEAATLGGDIHVAPQFRIDRGSSKRMITGRLNGGGRSVEACSINGKIIIEVI